MKTVEVFWSHQSPYCYFALDRLLALNGRGDVDLVLRPVLPGVIRDADIYRDRSEKEGRYFRLDVTRTAAFLGLPYAEADPYPVAFLPGTLYRAAEAQPRVSDLYHLTQAAIEEGRGWAFLDHVSRMIWDGSTRNWHAPAKMRGALYRAGLDYDALLVRARQNTGSYDRQIAANRQAMLEAGHWGVPLFAYEGEAFYGQDRFDQLLWRLGIT